MNVLFCMQMIVSINFNTNKLTKVPNSLFSIPTLKFLDLSHNELGSNKLVKNACLSEAIG